MRLAWLTFVCVLAISGSANAERLSFDHRVYPPLKESFDKNDKNLILYDDRNPRYIYDLIVIQGNSTAQWTEGFEIIARVKNRNLATPNTWFGELQSKSPRGCVNQFSTIAETNASLTFERHSAGCATNLAQSGLYRIIAGERSLFLLGALYKGDMTQTMRERWLALLATAQIEN